MISTSTSSEVHAVADRFRLKELGEVESDGHDNTGDEVEKCPARVAQ